MYHRNIQLQIIRIQINIHILIYTVTDLINELPGNTSVNMVQHATLDEAVSYVIRATPSAGNGPMNSQSDT
jgi:hypothetical protein